MENQELYEVTNAEKKPVEKKVRIHLPFFLNAD